MFESSILIETGRVGMDRHDWFGNEYPNTLEQQMKMIWKLPWWFYVEERIS